MNQTEGNPGPSTSLQPRHPAQIGAGLAPDSINRNVLNVLLALVEDPAAVVRINDDDYLRASPRSVDDRIVATGSDHYVVVTRVVSSQERFNFSLAGEDTRLVRPKSGKGRPTNMLVYRTYNIVRDGKLVYGRLEALMSESTFNQFRLAGLLRLGGVPLADDVKHQQDVYYEIDLNGLPIVSPAWARPEQQRLATLMRSEADLHATIQVLNKRKQALLKAGHRFPSRKPDADSLRVYRPKKEERMASDRAYTATCCTYELGLYKSSAVDASQWDLVSTETLLKQARREISIVRFKTRMIWCAIESCKESSIEWSEPVLSRFKAREVSAAIVDGAAVTRTRWTVQCARDPLAA